MSEIFTAAYIDGEMAKAVERKRCMEASLEAADLRVDLFNVMAHAGDALHAIFLAGDEPKWRDPSQREALMTLSTVLVAIWEKVEDAE